MTQEELINACCIKLIKTCVETNADKMTITQMGVFEKPTETNTENLSLGDWEIIVRRKKAGL